MSTASLTGPLSVTRPTQEQDGSVSLDHNTLSQSPFDRHPETNYTGPPPSYNDSINNESYYSVQSHQPQSQPQPHDTRFDGSHCEIEHLKELEKSGAELPLINYSQEPPHEPHPASETCYDSVQTQQPKPHEHLTNSVDNSHDYTRKDSGRESCTECDCEECCDNFFTCLLICDMCRLVCSDDD